MRSLAPAYCLARAMQHTVTFKHQAGAPCFHSALHEGTGSPHIDTVNEPKESKQRISIPISLNVEITHPFALNGFSFEFTALSAPGTLKPPFFLHATGITLCFHWKAKG